MFNDHHVAERGGEIATAGLKVAPPLAVSTAAIAGMTMEEWVVVLTLIYLGLQIFHLVWKTVRDLRRDRAGGGTDA